jgi:transcriptional regulator with XRE-family HTH domain
MTPDPLLAELRDRRKKAGLSLMALAAATGCAFQQISKWERGAWPAPSSLRRWAAALGVQPAWVPLTYELANEDVARTLDVAERTVEKAREARR